MSLNEQLKKKRIYKSSSGLYVVAHKKNRNDRHIAFKVGMSKNIINRLNKQYTFCYASTGYYIYNLVRVNHTIKLRTLEARLHRYLREKQGITQLRNVDRQRRTEWFKGREETLRAAINKWLIDNKQYIITSLDFEQPLYVSYPIIPTKRN